IPVVLLTAFGRDRELGAAAYALGVADVVPKPVDPWALRIKIRHLYDAHQRRLALEREIRELRARLAPAGVPPRAALPHPPPHPPPGRPRGRAPRPRKPPRHEPRAEPRPGPRDGPPPPGPRVRTAARASRAPRPSPAPPHPQPPPGHPAGAYAEELEPDRT